MPFSGASGLIKKQQPQYNHPEDSPMVVPSNTYNCNQQPHLSIDLSVYNRETFSPEAAANSETVPVEIPNLMTKGPKVSTQPVHQAQAVGVNSLCGENEGLKQADSAYSRPIVSAADSGLLPGKQAPKSYAKSSFFILVEMYNKLFHRNPCG